MDYLQMIEEAKKAGKKKWMVFHLTKEGNPNTDESYYEFYSHNPIKFTKKNICTYKNIFSNGFGFHEVGKKDYTIFKNGGVQK